MQLPIHCEVLKLLKSCSYGFASLARFLESFFSFLHFLWAQLQFCLYVVAGYLVGKVTLSPTAVVWFSKFRQ